MVKKQQIKILYIEDDKESFEIVEDYLKSSVRFDFEIEWASSYEDGVEAIKEGDFDVCLLDFYLCDRKSVEILKEEGMGEYISNKPFIVLTNENNKSTDLDMLRNGAIDYLVKDVVFPDKTHGAMLIERSIIYSIERKKLEKQIKEGYAIKKLLLESTNSGICMVDVETNKIIDCNDSFLKMFSFSNEMIENAEFNDLFNIKMYGKTILNTTELDGDMCGNTCPCPNNTKEVSVTAKTDVVIDCIMQCRRTIFKNGKTKSLKIITFTDITKQKTYQKKIVEMQKYMESIVKKYGIECNSPEVFMDLIGFELEKFKVNEETSL